MVVGLSLPTVVGLAFRSHYRQTGDRAELASQGISLVLDLDTSRSGADRHLRQAWKSSEAAAGKLAGLADLQRKQELKKKIQCPPVPLFREVRELLLEKCKRDKRRQVRAIVEKEAFGDLNA